MKQFLILGMILLFACTSEIQVKTDYDPDYDLWTYKTFDWGQKLNIEEGKNPLYYNELIDKRIKSAVKNQLTMRGYRLTDSRPDLILHYRITVDDKSTRVSPRDSYQESSFWLRMETNMYTYREGTLILDLMDSKTCNLIWRGWAVSVVDDSYTSEEVDRMIKTAVAKIFKKFPKTRNQF
jgi:hypothetical protein